MGPGGSYGHAEPVNKFVEFRNCMGGANARAGEDHWTFCITDALQDFAAIGREPCRISADIAARELLLRGIVTAKTGGIDGRSLHVDRNIKPARDGASTVCEVPGALEVISGGERVVDQHRVFGDVRNHGDDVGFLVSELPQSGDPLDAHAGLALDLAGYYEHRDGVGPRPEHSIQSVDAAGPGGDVDHAGLAADASVSFGGHSGSLFMVITHILNARLPANRVIEVHCTTARDQEDVAHAPIRQTPNDVVGELHERRTGEWTSRFEFWSSEITGLLSPRRRI